MKNCTNCGSPMDDNAAFCPNCGTAAAPVQPAAPETPVAPQAAPSYQAPVEPQPAAQQNPYQTNSNPAPTYNPNGAYNPYAQPSQSTNIPALVGFILSLVGIPALFIGFGWLLGIAGIVLSIIGMVQVKKTNQKGKGFALAGLIIGIVLIVLTIVAVIYVIAAYGYYYNLY
ncbi:MAG: DUF4190 domain-containing protein [Anaerofustis sp.]